LITKRRSIGFTGEVQTRLTPSLSSFAKFFVKLPAQRAGLPGKEISFYIVPLDPAYLPTGRQARRGFRGTFRPDKNDF
jgi:hypothetical protein